MSFIDLPTKSILLRLCMCEMRCAANKAVSLGSLGSCVSLCVFIPRIMDGITRLSIQEFTPPRRNLSNLITVIYVTVIRYKLAFSMFFFFFFFGTNSLAT